MNRLDHISLIVEKKYRNKSKCPTVDCGLWGFFEFRDWP